MELYLRNWYDKFLDELSQTKTLRVISPFVSEHVIVKMQGLFNFNNFELITRFNLSDFALKVSSLSGLKFSVLSGASVFGIRDLHSKIYLFDERAAIVTSANLTSGGLLNNYECGIYLTDHSTIEKLHRYFNDLKRIAGDKLTLQQCDDWQQQIPKTEVCNTIIPSLPDFGSTVTRVDTSKTYYIKFFGTAHNRVPLTFTVKDEIDRALCHYACGFSENKKPRQIQDGDVIYMARMTYDPRDYAIFGKAEAIKFVDARDRATELEIEERSWKKDWPIYLRVTNPVFIDGTMNDCVFLHDLIKALDYQSFLSTQRRYEKGERNISPNKSLSQQAYVKLTTKAVEWLEPKFQDALHKVGKVDNRFIASLLQPQNSIVS